MAEAAPGAHGGPTAPATAPAIDTGKRVKWYVLDKKGIWDDRGTGLVRCENALPDRQQNNAPRSGSGTASGLRLRFETEDPSAEGVLITIQQDTSYHLQGRTIISWTERRCGPPPADMALSFAEAAGCRDVWDRICSAQAPLSVPSPSHPHSTAAISHTAPPSNPEAAANASPNGPAPPDANLLNVSDDPNSARALDDSLDTPWSLDVIDDRFSDANMITLAQPAAPPLPHDALPQKQHFGLPPPGRDGLDELVRILADPSLLHKTFLRDRLSAMLVAGEYVTALCTIFRESEHDQDLITLSKLFVIMRSLCLLGSHSLVEVLMRNTLVMDVIGCLEYDPDSVLSWKNSHFSDAQPNTEPQEALGSTSSPTLTCAEESVDANRDPGSAIDGNSGPCTGKNPQEGASNGKFVSAEETSSNGKDLDGVSDPSASHESEQVVAARCESAPGERRADVADENDVSAAQKNTFEGKIVTDTNSTQYVETDVRSFPGTPLPDAKCFDEMAAHSSPGEGENASSLIAPTLSSSQKRSCTASANPGTLQVAFSGDTDINSGMQTPANSNNNSPLLEQKAAYAGSSLSSERPEPCGMGLTKKQECKGSSEQTQSSGNDVEKHQTKFVLRRHRNFLEKNATFKSVVPITDERVLSKIHQNYHVSYIRDVILARSMDEVFHSAFGMLINFNNVDILMYFLKNKTLVEGLVSQLKISCDRFSLARNGGTDNEDEGTRKKRRSSADSNSRVLVSSSQSVSSGENSSTVPDDKGNLQDSRSNDRGTTGSSSRDSDCPNSAVVKEFGRSTDIRDEMQSDVTEKSTVDVKNGFTFLIQLCEIAKIEQGALRTQLHGMLRDCGALEMCLCALRHGLPAVQLLASNLLSAVANQDQSDLRAYMIRAVADQPSDTPAVAMISRANRVPPSPFRSVPISYNVLNSSLQQRTVGATEVTNNFVTAKQPQTCKKTSKEDLRDLPKVNEDNLVTNLHFPTKEVTRSGKDEIAAQEVGRALTKSLPQHASENLSVVNHGCGEENLNKSNYSCRNSASSTIINDMISENRIVASTTKPRKGELENDEGVSETNSDHSQRAACSSSLLQSHSAVANPAKNNLRPFSPSCKKRPRGHVTSEQSNNAFPLLGAMVDVLCGDRDLSVILQVLELLRGLLDPTSMRGLVDRERFVMIFYENFAGRLLAPITAVASKNGGLSESAGNLRVPEENVSHLCDLLSFCVTNHMYFAKYFVLTHNVGEKVLRLLKHEKKYIRLSALRFLRTCVGARDDDYDKYILRNNLLDPIMRLYRENENRDNLVSSAVLDMVDFIARAHRVSLLEALVERHAETLEPSSKLCSAFADARTSLQLARTSGARPHSSTQTVTIPSQNIAQAYAPSLNSAGHLLGQDINPPGSPFAPAPMMRFGMNICGPDIRNVPDINVDEPFIGNLGEDICSNLADLGTIVGDRGGQGIGGTEWLENSPTNLICDGTEEPGEDIPNQSKALKAEDSLEASVVKLEEAQKDPICLESKPDTFHCISESSSSKSGPNMQTNAIERPDDSAAPVLDTSSGLVRGKEVKEPLSLSDVQDCVPKAADCVPKAADCVNAKKRLREVQSTDDKQRSLVEDNPPGDGIVQDAIWSLEDTIESSLETSAGKRKRVETKRGVLSMSKNSLEVSGIQIEANEDGKIFASANSGDVSAKRTKIEGDSPRFCGVEVSTTGAPVKGSIEESGSVEENCSKDAVSNAKRGLHDSPTFDFIVDVEQPRETDDLRKRSLKNDEGREKAKDLER